MEMGKKKPSLPIMIVKLCGGILAVFCYLQALRCMQEIELYDSLISIEIAQGTTAAGIQKPEEELTVTFWAALGEGSVGAEATGAVQISQVYLLRGPSEGLLLEATGLLPGDEKGCLLDEKTSYGLFGSTNVCGQAVEWEGQTYQVRNVIPGKQGIFLIQSADETQIFSRVNILCREKGRRLEKARQFLLQNQLDGRIWDGFWILLLLKGTLLFLPFVLIVRMLSLLQSRRRRTEESRARQLFYCVCIWGTALVFFVAALYFMEIPRDMIPTRWSDFAFWGRLWKEKAATLSSMIQREKSPGEMRQMQRLATGCLFGLFSGFVGWRVVAGIPPGRR